MRDVVIIPTYNEKKNIGKIIKIISSLLPSLHILVVDDNSPDGTANEVQDLKKEIPHLELLLRPKKEGLGKAYTAAFKTILADRDVRCVCTMDADFSHDPKYLLRMFSEINKFDVVIGSKYIKGGRINRLALYRKILSRTANFYFRALLRLPVRDCTSGFICMKAPLLRKIDLEEIESSGFAFLVELKYLLRKKGACFKEFPIVLSDRTAGKSKMTRGIILRVILEEFFTPWKLIFKNYARKLNNLLAVIKEVYKKRGIYFIARYGPEVFYRTYLKKKKFFIFQNKKYHYFYHPYNCTCLNERAVEIPIVWEIVKDCQGKRILEVGNVLSHYFKCYHDIIDKYEKFEGVINQDVVDFQPKEKYDLIVSISTLEHVGFDEMLKSPQKILLALQNLKRCLNPGGKIIFTAGLGYNPEFDNLLKESEIKFTEQYFFKKDENITEWREVAWDEVRDIKYNFHQYTANYLIVGVIENI